MGEQYNHEHLPPPIGIHRELPLSTAEVLKQTLDQDPDFARWVLFRSEELARKLDEWHQNGTDPRQTDIKEDFAAILLEARELMLAIQQNNKLRELFEES